MGVGILGSGVGGPGPRFVCLRRRDWGSGALGLREELAGIPVSWVWEKRGSGKRWDSPMRVILSLAQLLLLGNFPGPDPG